MNRFPSSTGSSTGSSTQPINGTPVKNNSNVLQTPQTSINGIPIKNNSDVLQTPQSSSQSVYNAITRNNSGSTQHSALHSTTKQYHRRSINGNGSQKGNGNGSQKGNGNGSQNINGNGSQNRNGNGSQNRNGNGSQKGNGNGIQNRNGNGSQNRNGNQSNGIQKGNGTQNGNKVTGNYYINNNNKLKKNDFVYNNTSPWPMIPLGSHMGQSVFMQDYLIRNFNKVARQKFMKNVKYEYVNNLKINGKNLGPTLILSTLKNKLTKEIEHEQKCIEEKKKLDTAFDNYVKCLKENGIITNTNKMKSNYNKMINDLNISNNGITNQTPLRYTRDQKEKWAMANTSGNNPREMAKAMRGKQLQFKEPQN